jgi:Transcriptional regulator, AbiEi antitoxin
MGIEIPDECSVLIMVQRGVIGRDQAIKAGLSSASIGTLLRTGRWQRLHRGVYATFTGPPGQEALRWAALIRAGPGSVLSHVTAADLFGFGLPPGQETPIHVTVPWDTRLGQISGVVVHRARQAQRRRQPYMLPPRTRLEATVLDLADGAATVEDAFGWICRAMGKRLTDADRLRTEVGRRDNVRWRRAMLDALDDVEQGVRSNLEFRYVRGVERPHGLPKAQRQVQVVRSGRVHYLDNLYGAYSVGVELDGLVAHPPGERWRDFRRDNSGAADGIITLRYGWSDVTGRPCAVADQVGAVLGRRGWAGSVRPCGPSCAAVRGRARRDSKGECDSGG